MGIILVNNLKIRSSIADGPGVRTVVFLQGCSRRCPGCHNKHTWDPEAGIRVSIDKLAAIIRRNTPNKKVTISGGEPLQQMAGVIELVKALKGFDITLYTSFELEEVPREVLNNITYIKTGAFEQALKTTTKTYVGSLNQKFTAVPA